MKEEKAHHTLTFQSKNVILVMLVILGMVTFLDRINISVAGSSIMHDLKLSPAQWGWVQSAFILSYGLMQIPMGWLGDRFGHRKILAAIVLWWSLFTAFTGMAGGLLSLLAIRFMFGIGEAGSSPCSTGVISRWFKNHEVGKAQGYVWAASRLGGALTPFVVIPVMMWVGWRSAFYLLGALGIVWALVWYVFYRDNSHWSEDPGAPCRHHQRSHEHSGKYWRFLLWHPLWRDGAAVGQLQFAALHDSRHAHRERTTLCLHQPREAYH